MDWASRWSVDDSVNDKKITHAGDALHVGDVVWVRSAFRSSLGRFRDYVYTPEQEVAWIGAFSDRASPKQPSLALEQTPRLQAALYAYDHESGYVTAMAGGLDHDTSEFNRAVQACRQPGRAYKPIYYSLALDITLWRSIAGTPSRRRSRTSPRPRWIRSPGRSGCRRTSTTRSSIK
jgi:penicillin-binding protein 1A